MTTNALYLGRDWTVEHDQTVRVDGATLKYAVVGTGEPVLCIHGTNMADSMVTPLRFFPPLLDDYQFISYYRAGYNGSTLDKPEVSIEDGAEHAKQVLDHLGVDKAHIMAFSFGGVIAFQFLLSYPQRAHSAILLEPYLPREEPAAVRANIDAYQRALAIYQTGDKLGAAQQYMADICGPYLLSAVDMTGPLDVWQRIERCVDTVFQVDFPAITKWGFRMSEADKFGPKPGMPVLAAMGLDSESVLPGFREVQRFLMEWLPQAERLGVTNATHGMQIMNPVEVAQGAYGFLHKHPMNGR
jgi:pimeloyl-ACP methyl ester carboxylesterase